MCVCVVVGCGGDKKVEFNYEKKYGNVREIYTTFYENGNIRVSSNIPSKYVDSFDMKGNRLKRTKYIYDFLYYKNGDFQWENEGSKIVIRQKFRLNGIEINKYDSEFGLIRSINLDKNGKLEEFYEYKKINDTTISVTEFDRNKKIKYWNSIIIDDENIVVSYLYFDKDSILDGVTKPNILKGKSISSIYTRIYTNKDVTHTKTTYKYISFDKEGNWIERDIISDIPSSDGIKYEKVTKVKRNISYYK